MLLFARPLHQLLVMQSWTMCLCTFCMSFCMKNGDTIVHLSYCARDTTVRVNIIINVITHIFLPKVIFENLEGKGLKFQIISKNNVKVKWTYHKSGILEWHSEDIFKPSLRWNSTVITNKHESKIYLKQNQIFKIWLKNIKNIKGHMFSVS